MRSMILSAAVIGLALSVGCRTTDDDEDTEPTGTIIDTDEDTDNDTEAPFNCDEGPSDPDAFWGPLDKAQVTTTAPTNDAGIGALLAQAPAEGQSVTLDPPLLVTDAVVSASEFVPEGSVPDDLWLRDSGGAIRTYANFRDDPPKIVIPDDITGLGPGSVVSFKVTELTNYFGEIQISALEDFTVSPTSGLVYVVDATDGTEVTFADHRAEVVRIWGRVAEERGECGTNTYCYGIETNGNTYELRIRKDEYEVGDCLPIANPVGQFQGKVQFNVSDFDAVGRPF